MEIRGARIWWSKSVKMFAMRYDVRKVGVFALNDITVL